MDAHGEPINIHKHVQYLLDTSPKLNNIDAQLVLRDMHETVHGIHDHRRSNASPLSLIAMNDCENISTGSLLHERINNFLDRDVYKYTGCNLKEFLDLPREHVIYILERCSKRQEISGNEADLLAQKLKDLQGGDK